jgi:polyhydroxyalkanoate synthesis repressor PhaR
MDDVVQIKKYPNRRLYDQTHSRHLTQGQLHEMVASGRRVRIIDSASGDDITNAVLLQLLVDRDASRLAAIPAVFLHLLVQGQESLVRSSMDHSMRWFGEQARAATQPMDAWAQAAASFLGPAGWTGPLGWMNAAGPSDASDTAGGAAPGSTASAPDDATAPEQEVAALRDAMGTLLDQLRTMESRLEELEQRSSGDER